MTYPGAANSLDETAHRARRFDLEGIRIDSHQARWISDEYGPYIIRFDRQGNFLEELSAPMNLLIQHPSPSGSEEDSRNQSGRRSNRGMEGLALTPSARFLLGIFPSPLLQESYLSDKGQPLGFHSRINRFDLKQGTTSQYVYR